jgi:NADH-quinone oxidoreductase subunit J
MTTKPEFEVGSHLVPGLAAVALFLVMAAIIVGAPFGDPTGFPADANIVASIGYAMFNLEGAVGSESFLVAFLLIALVLDAALEGSVHLARREDSEDPAGPVADGGRALDRSTGGDAPTDATDAEGGDR